MMFQNRILPQAREIPVYAMHRDDVSEDEVPLHAPYGLDVTVRSEAPLHAPYGLDFTVRSEKSWRLREVEVDSDADYPLSTPKRQKALQETPRSGEEKVTSAFYRWTNKPRRGKSKQCPNCSTVNGNAKRICDFCQGPL